MPDLDRPRCAIYMLRDDAMSWWKGAKLTVDLAMLTWEEFKKIFYDQYCTANVRTELKREFLTLKQGDHSMRDYIHKFERGCYFVLLNSGDAEENICHIVDGLRTTLKHDVRLAKPKQ
ncbi:hypothetical protein F511_22784 [Dorcoceras hygrometricum]|uniref:Retrotransposon gag domain-containing protein n=1 Tax=Dorcoceras hygrometricum TaxID=472368 RepID=A0A2Z7C6I9_9LAMI|nr:hypothetical protein F511_22784 [Dorcoceras hygrometricum]